MTSRVVVVVVVAVAAAAAVVACSACDTVFGERNFAARPCSDADPCADGFICNVNGLCQANGNEGEGEGAEGEGGEGEGEGGEGEGEGAEGEGEGEGDQGLLIPGVDVVAQALFSLAGETPANAFDDSTDLSTDDDSTLGGFTRKIHLSQSNGQEVVIIELSSFVLSQGSTLRIHGTKPMAFIVDSDALINGDIIVDCGATGDLNVNGQNVPAGNLGGGGGGAHGIVGGDGAGPAFGRHGNVGGTADQRVMTTGGAGGVAGPGGAGESGAGGRAIYIGASGDVVVNGTIAVIGCGGLPTVDGSGGGGAGGSIVLEGNTVSVDGTLNVAGGTGGADPETGVDGGALLTPQAVADNAGGDGGAGRVRINARVRPTLDERIAIGKNVEPNIGVLDDAKMCASIITFGRAVFSSDPDTVATFDPIVQHFAVDTAHTVKGTFGGDDAMGAAVAAVDGLFFVGSTGFDETSTDNGAVTRFASLTAPLPAGSRLSIGGTTVAAAGGGFLGTAVAATKDIAGTVTVVAGAPAFDVVLEWNDASGSFGSATAVAGAGAGELFGQTVALSSDGLDLVVGAPAADGSAGKVYIFHRDAIVDGFDSGSADVHTIPGCFNTGLAVAIGGDLVVIGCNSHAQVLRGPPGNRVPDGGLLTSPVDAAGTFGLSLAVDAANNEIFVADPADDSCGSGVGNIFVARPDDVSGGWFVDDVVPDRDPRSAQVRRPMAVSEGRLVVGAPGKLNQVGEAQVLDRDPADPTSFSTTFVLDANANALSFGAAVAIEPGGGHVVVGAPSSDLESGGANAGACFVYDTP